MPLVWGHRGGGGAGGRALDRCRRHRARVLRHQPHPGDLRHLSELLLTPADPALVDTRFTLPSTADGIRHCSPSPATARPGYATSSRLTARSLAPPPQRPSIHPPCAPRPRRDPQGPATPGLARSASPAVPLALCLTPLSATPPP